MEFSFFTTGNKSGYKTNERWLGKNHPEELGKILTYSNDKIPNSSTIKEKIWLYYHNLPSRPKCVGCGGEIIFSERFDRGYNDFCSVKCINSQKDEMNNRIKKSMNEKYGVDYYPKHKDFKDKVKKTVYSRYGVDNVAKLKSSTLKSKKTRLKKYGDPNYCNYEKHDETCLRKYGVNNYTKSKNFKYQIDLNYKNLNPDINILKINNGIVTIKCDKCNKNCDVTKHIIYGRSKSNQEICTFCNPIGQTFISYGEQQIVDFIKSIGVNVFQTHKILPNKKEIDIFLPDFNIGLEYDGLYWHNELFVDRKYHLNKTNDSKNLNINLIHIFEDEWIHKRPIVESIIRNKIGKIENKIFGRKCNIKELLPKESNLFLNKNHIQGTANSKIRLGLYYDEELVSVMTFSSGRKPMGGKSDEWELTRFCNKIHTNVIGAASKLFSYFIKVYSPKKIVSYSDIRLFDGKMYEKLGFIKIHESEPNYWYIINGLRYHRFGFRKSLLIKEGYDPNKTEQQIMLDRKIYRIYDCGNVRWEYNI